MQIDNGRYRAKAVDSALGETGTGTPQIGIKFEFLDYPGTYLTAYRFFTENALAYTVKDMRTCGWVGDDLEQIDTLYTNEVEIVVENEEYPQGSGKWSPKVKWINAPGGGSVGMRAQLDAGGKKTFAALMKNKIRQADPAGAKAADAAKKAVKEIESTFGGPNDDIPF